MLCENHVIFGCRRFFAPEAMKRRTKQTLGRITYSFLTQLIRHIPLALKIYRETSMHTAEEIETMFKDMGLETDRKRASYLFSFSGEQSIVYDKLICYRPDTKTQEIKEQRHAELE